MVPPELLPDYFHIPTDQATLKALEDATMSRNSRTATVVLVKWLRDLAGGRRLTARRPRTGWRRRELEILEDRTVLSGTPALTPQLIPPSGGPASVTIPLTSYQFGFQNTVNLGSSSGGAGAGKASFDELKVSAPLSGASPQLDRKSTRLNYSHVRISYAVFCL